MPLTNQTLPSIAPEWVVPFDAQLAFAAAQTLTSTGYVNDLNSGLVDLGPGRYNGYLVLEPSALDLASGDEKYAFYLLGSNDSSFGNGNCELLASYDFAAATGDRLVPTLCPPSTAVPPTGRAGQKFVKPFSNQMGTFIFRHLKLRAVIGGTSPSITLGAWVTADLC